MSVAYRIAMKRHARSAFDGEGASKYGGRWNSKGVRMVYASETRALAALEILVHIDRGIPVDWVVLRCEIPDKLVEVLPPSALPDGWRDEPPTAASRRVGDRWAREGRSAVLRVPSAVVPGENNYLINPVHRDIRRIVVGRPQPFAFDPRLVRP